MPSKLLFPRDFNMKFQSAMVKAFHFLLEIKNCKKKAEQPCFLLNFNHDKTWEKSSNLRIS